MSAKWISLALLMGAVAFTGCTESDDEKFPSAPNIALGAKTLDFTHTTETKSVEFESNYAWTALKPSSANWVRLNPDAGDATEGTINIAFLVDNNTQAVERRAVIRFAQNKGTQMDSIVITQSPFILHPEQYKDSMALVKLYNDCKGYNWAGAWDLDNPFDQWAGITTDLIGGQKRVVEMDFVNRGLQGALPQQLTDLTELRKFVIYNANIGTTLPLWFTQFPKLTFLALPACEMKGTIPEEYYNMTQLTRLDLLENFELGGAISPKIGQLVNLEILDWRKCSFTGAIPSEIGNMSKLKAIYLLNNSLTGVIPTTIGNLTNLETLILSANQLSGAIPTTIGNLSKLEVFDITENQVSGSLPSQFGNCRLLWDFRALNNNLTGVIPSELGALPELQILNLGGNQLSGTIPETLLANPELVHLVLRDNQITGAIDSTLSRLETVDLRNNNFSGVIPNKLFLSYSIQDFYLNGNSELEGDVPAEFFQRGNFLNVDFSGIANLGGSFPSDMSNFYSMSFRIAGCNFTGTIPEDLFLVKDLATLDLSDNKFTGNIPTQITSATQLFSFKVNGNRLTGEFAPIIKTHIYWNNWNASLNICPQEGLGFTGCN